MAQGKLKVKTAKVGKQKNKNNRNNSKPVRKGHKVIAPKKTGELQAHQFKKNIQKAINKNIESELASVASQVEEGKRFNVIKNANQQPKKSKK